jgi:hypothetical protein
MTHTGFDATITVNEPSARHRWADWRRRSHRSGWAGGGTHGRHPGAVPAGGTTRRAEAWLEFWRDDRNKPPAWVGFAIGIPIGLLLWALLIWILILVW